MNEHTVRAKAPESAAKPVRPFLGRRMIILATLSQNLAQGLMFGSFGTLVVEIEHRMHVARGLSAAGASLVILALGVLSPFIGRLLNRFSIRFLMIVGALSCGAGYSVAAAAPNIGVLLLAYALLVGPGVALLGLALPSALVANWFVDGRGRALGVVNMSFLVAIVPPICAALLPRLGLSGLYLGLAGLTFLLVPALLLVIDRPEQVGQRALGAPPGGEKISEHQLSAKSSEFFGSVDYWRLGLAAAMLGGGAAMLVTHIMPMATGRGISTDRAALLISVLGAMGAVGSFAYGWLAERVGGGRALAINGAVQALLWCGFLLRLDFPLLFLVTTLVGVSAGGMVSALGMALSQRFGAEKLGGALGSWSLINLPFSVGLPALAGFLFSKFGTYFVPFALQIGLLIIAVALAETSARRIPFALSRKAPTG